MRKSSWLGLTALLMLVAVGCTSTIAGGSAALPEGIREAQLPDAELGGYVYVKADPPLRLNTQLLSPAQSADGSTPSVALQRATLMLGASPDDFGGILEFDSQEGADTAWSEFQKAAEDSGVWGKTASPRLLFANGVGPWADSIRESLDSGNFVALPDYDPAAWNMITNLPEEPPAPPVAAGVIHVDGGLLEGLAAKSGMTFEGLGEAFGLVRVSSIAFGVYSNSPLDITRPIDEDFLIETNSGLVMVSHSDYTGALVSFMVSVVADRTQMELIEFSGTNARYRTLGNMHLILKNKGSLVYAAMAGTQEQAQTLITSATR
ncbi:MAG: hypothetical protein L0177_00900 [Chloroflexi bacterium]|nr:hypothetical protein [Chloroflexota bacterium]